MKFYLDIKVGFHMIDRVMVFMDGENLFHGCKNYEKMCNERDGTDVKYNVDHILLRDKLVGKRKLIRAYYYGSLPNDDEKREGQIRFHHKLEFEGFKTTIIPLKKRKYYFKCDRCGNEQQIEKSIEKGVDIALVTDLITFGVNKIYDTAIIVSGDFDYHKAIEEVQRNGAKVEIAYFDDGGIGADLKRHADKFIPLNDMADEIRRK
jgi:uncharacterized LabA/DUF88 family protein